LPRDVGDQADDAADPVGPFGQRGDDGVGALRVADRQCGHLGGLGDLAADFVDGRGQFLGRGGDGLHAGARFFRRRGDHAGLRIGALRAVGHGTRRRLQFSGARGEQSDHVACRRFERGDQLFQPRRALFLLRAFGGLFGGLPVGCDHAVLEHLDGFGHLPNLIDAAARRDLGGHIPSGELAHGLGQGLDGGGDRLDEEHPGQGGSEHGEDAEADDISTSGRIALVDLGRQGFNPGYVVVHVGMKGRVGLHASRN